MYSFTTRPTCGLERIKRACRRKRCVERFGSFAWMLGEFKRLVITFCRAAGMWKFGDDGLPLKDCQGNHCGYLISIAHVSNTLQVLVSPAPFQSKWWFWWLSSCLKDWMESVIWAPWGTAYQRNFMWCRAFGSDSYTDPLFVRSFSFDSHYDPLLNGGQSLAGGHKVCLAASAVWINWSLQRARFLGWLVFAFPGFKLSRSVTRPFSVLEMIICSESNQTCLIWSMLPAYVTKRPKLLARTSNLCTAKRL